VRKNPPPPHPISVNAKLAKEISANARLTLRERCLRVKPMPHKQMEKANEPNGIFRSGSTRAAGTATWPVNTVCAPATPGMTASGLKLASAPGGSPVTDIVTTLLNAPPLGRGDGFEYGDRCRSGEGGVSRIDGDQAVDSGGQVRGRECGHPGGVEVDAAE